MTHACVRTTAGLAMLALTLTLARALPAEEPENPERTKAALAELLRTIPNYEDPYKDGLYSTIVAMLTVGSEELKNQKKVKLRPEGWKKDLTVRAIVQDGPAPLVVVIPGVDGKADSPLGRLFPYWLDRYLGWHVLSFDSPFRPTFEDASRHGVSGYIPADCEAVAQVVAAYLKRDEVRGKVTQIGVAGYCLGGLHAAGLAKMSAEKRLPFELAGAVAFSPPVRLQSTAELLDLYYAQDRWKYTMIDMGKVFMSHEPVAPGAPIPWEPAFMRAGMGFIVREEFTEIVDQNDSIFRLKCLPNTDNDPTVNRQSQAQAWGFTRFIEKMSFPYWQKKASVPDAATFWRASDLETLLKDAPPYLRVVLAADDPFNKPEDLEALRKVATGERLRVLNNGGHLGFIGAAITFSHLGQMFNFK